MPDGSALFGDLASSLGFQGLIASDAVPAAQHGESPRPAPGGGGARPMDAGPNGAAQATSPRTQEAGRTRAAEASPVPNDALSALTDQMNQLELRGLGTVVAAGDEGKVQRLLEKGAPVDQRDDHGWTPLMLACKLGDVDRVRQLLGARADPNAEEHRVEDRRTALQIAIFECQTVRAADVVAALLESGASVHRPALLHETIVMHASSPRGRIVDLLLAAQADVNAPMREQPASPTSGVRIGGPGGGHIMIGRHSTNDVDRRADALVPWTQSEAAARLREAQRRAARRAADAAGPLSDDDASSARFPEGSDECRTSPGRRSPSDDGTSEMEFMFGDTEPVGQRRPRPDGHDANPSPSSSLAAATFACQSPFDRPTPARMKVLIHDWTVAPSDMRTPLHVAAALGLVDIIEKLLAKGADATATVRTRTLSRATPLWLAVENNQVAAIEALVAHAPRSLRSKCNGWQPYDYASMQSKIGKCKTWLPAIKALHGALLAQAAAASASGESSGPPAATVAAPSPAPAACNLTFSASSAPTTFAFGAAPTTDQPFVFGGASAVQSSPPPAATPFDAAVQGWKERWVPAQEALARVRSYERLLAICTADAVDAEGEAESVRKKFEKLKEPSDADMERERTKLMRQTMRKMIALDEVREEEATAAHTLEERRATERPLRAALEEPVRVLNELDGARRRKPDKYEQLNVRGFTRFSFRKGETPLKLPTHQDVDDTTAFNEYTFNNGIGADGKPAPPPPGVKGRRWHGRTAKSGKGDAAWVTSIEAQVKAWLGNGDEESLNWLATTTGDAPKTVCAAHALKAGVDGRGNPATTPRQTPLHADSCEPNSHRASHAPWGDAHLAMLIALQDGTQLHVCPFDKDGKEETITLNAGDVLIFRGDLIHAGAEYGELNVRIHVYIDSPCAPEPRDPTATYAVHADSAAYYWSM